MPALGRYDRGDQEVVKLALLAAERLLEGKWIAKGGAWRIKQ